MRIRILFLLTLLLTGCGAEKTNPEYIAEIDQWHAERIERLRSDTGWLTLVGLHPLPVGFIRWGRAPMPISPWLRAPLTGWGPWL